MIHICTVGQVLASRVRRFLSAVECWGQGW